MSIAPAKLQRPSARALPYADRLQDGLPSPSCRKDTYVVPAIPPPPHLPAITASPAHADNINTRALAQSSRCLAAKSVALEDKDTVRGGSQQDEDAGTKEVQDGDTSCVPPEEQDLNAAGILVEVAKEQHLISPAMDIGSTSDNLSAINRLIAYSERCPVITCEYRDHRFPSKSHRDWHAITHYEGDLKCGCALSYSGGLPLSQIVRFRLHVRDCAVQLLKCWMCFNFFTRSHFLEHFNDCIVRTVELEASGRARGCSFTTCDHHLTEFPTKYLREQHMKRKHYWPSLSCDRCFNFICQCPPTGTSSDSML